MLEWAGILEGWSWLGRSCFLRLVAVFLTVIFFDVCRVVVFCHAWRTVSAFGFYRCGTKFKRRFGNKNVSDKLFVSDSSFLHM